ncbi:MAG: tryptophan--tRNA ligase [Sumerlaeia bacterium]
MRILTGVKPTGRPHLGNYFGSIKPSLELSKGRESFLFIADLHALTTLKDGVVLREMVYDVAATWLALGLNPDEIVFYRQSDVPEISELNWILSCYTAQGLLERAHAYKAARDAGQEVNAGLYTYPVLMSADILMFRSTHVPVGQDQRQHLEIARDIAQRFNHYHGEVLVLPDPIINDNVAVIPGLDGRKMSKSYDNTIPIFDSAKAIKEKVFSIVTDSTPLEEPKNPDANVLFKMYQLLAGESDAADVRAKLEAGGYGWGHLKKAVHGVIMDGFADARARYDHLMANRGELDAIFAQGAVKARAEAARTLDDVKRAVGLL